MIRRHIRFPRKRIVVPLLLISLLLIAALAVSADAPPNVDTFSDSQAKITVLGGGSDQGSEITGTATEILGQYRDMYLYNVTGPSSLVANIEVAGTAPGIYAHSQDVGIFADSILTYDGQGGGSQSPNLSGLCSGSTCVDLTQDGLSNGFRIRLRLDDSAMNVTIKVYEGNTTPTKCSVATFPNLFPGGVNAVTGPKDIYVEFPTIIAQTGSDCTGGDADFSNVGAVEFYFNGYIDATDVAIDLIDVSVFDWGDLPQNVDGTCPSNPQAGYATTQACKGPRHVVSNSLYLGGLVDPAPAAGSNPSRVGEFNGQPSPNAKGDDTNPLLEPDDEDGVTPLDVGTGSCPVGWCNGSNGGKIDVQVTGNGYLVGWIDFDGDGFELSEAIVNQPVSAPSYVFNFDIPAGTLPTGGFKSLPARFRLFGAGELTDLNCPVGCRTLLFDGRNGFGLLIPAQAALNQAKDGEIEDYIWTAGPLGVTLASFEAEARTDHVLVTWETNTEIGNRGFNMWRGTSSAGPDIQLNETLIPSQSQGNPGGFIYTWEDRADLVAGTTYFYWLEDLDVNGVLTRHGPVSVDFVAPTAVTLNGIQASPAVAGSTLPLAGTMLALLASLGGGLAVARRRRT